MTMLSRRTLLRLSILGGVLSTLSYLLLTTPATAVAIWFVGGITSMIAMIATMSLAADACPEGAEGFGRVTAARAGDTRISGLVLSGSGETSLTKKLCAGL